MITLDEYQRLVRQVERLRTARDRAEGVRSALLKRLKYEFGCGSVEEAEAELKRLEKAELKALDRYQVAKKAFYAEWGDVLKAEGV